MRFILLRLKGLSSHLLDALKGALSHKLDKCSFLSTRIRICENALSVNSCQVEQQLKLHIENQQARIEELEKQESKSGDLQSKDAQIKELRTLVKDFEKQKKDYEEARELCAYLHEKVAKLEQKCSEYEAISACNLKLLDASKVITPAYQISRKSSCNLR